MDTAEITRKSEKLRENNKKRQLKRLLFFSINLLRQKG